MHAVDVDEGADGTTVSVRYRPGGGAGFGPPAMLGPAAVDGRTHGAACWSRT